MQQNFMMSQVDLCFSAMGTVLLLFCIALGVTGPKYPRRDPPVRAVGVSIRSKLPDQDQGIGVELSEIILNLEVQSKSQGIAFKTKEDGLRFPVSRGGKPSSPVTMKTAFGQLAASVNHVREGQYLSFVCDLTLLVTVDDKYWPLIVKSSWRYLDSSDTAVAIARINEQMGETLSPGEKSVNVSISCSPGTLVWESQDNLGFVTDKDEKKGMIGSTITAEAAIEFFRSEQGGNLPAFEAEPTLTLAP